MGTQSAEAPVLSSLLSGDKRDLDRGEQAGCRVLLVRHALAEGNGRFQGQLDVELTDAGRRQLPALVQKLSRFPIDAAYASDLARARVTAAAIAKHFHVPLECRPSLREMDFGSWQGLSWNEIETRFPRLAPLWLKRFPRQQVPGGESFRNFKKRITGEVRAIVAGDRGRCVVVVTHAGVIRVLLASALGISDREMFRRPQEHCAVNVIDHFTDRAFVRCMNA